MEFLPQQNRRNEGDSEEALLRSMGAAGTILATGKRVVIIGGGDTGADCLGTSHRQGAKSVHQFEIMPKPPAERAASTPWPLWPLQLRTESSHEEGGNPRLEHQHREIHRRRARQRQAASLPFASALRPSSKPTPAPSSPSTSISSCSPWASSVPSRNGMIEQLGLALDNRGNIATTDYMSSVDGIFAAGDMRRGQSLVVWAISEGRKAAAAVNEYLAAERRKSPGPLPPGRCNFLALSQAGMLGTRGPAAF